MDISKIIRIGFSIVENLSGPQESIFSLVRGPKLNSPKESNKLSNLIKLPPFPLLAHVGPMAVWGPLGCCYFDRLSMLHIPSVTQHAVRYQSQHQQPQKSVPGVRMA